MKNRLEEFDAPVAQAEALTAPVAVTPVAVAGALKRTFWFGCLFLVLLELWRPFYFLADDNLIYWFPLVHGIGERLWSGQSPFVEPNLFGGYDLLRDPVAISLWNPLVLGLSLLAKTPLRLAIVDLFASANLLICALCFTLLGCRLRESKSLQLSDGRIAFLSLSFTFSAYALSIGACWGMFLANQASLPMIALGLFAARRKTGVAWIAGGLLYALLVGHLSPFLTTFLFLSLLVLGLCWAERDFEPLRRWGAGIALALLLASPLLLPAGQAYFSSPRSGSFDPIEAAQSAVPFPALIAAYFGGYIGLLLGSSVGLMGRHLVLGLASCAANFGVFAGRGRRFGRLDWVFVGLLLLVALWMSRPQWLGAFISHVPLYRSLRWPFRELFFFLFLSHLWILLRPVTLKSRALLALDGLGVTVFLVSLAMVPPWNFSAMAIDRELLRSGQAQAFWEHVKPLIGPGNRIIPVAPRSILKNQEKQIPYSLIGAVNYPALFGVPSLSGYTAQGLSQQKSGGELAYFGIYTLRGGETMMAKNAHLKTLRLISVQPLRIDLCDRAGCQTLPVPPTLPTSDP